MKTKINYFKSQNTNSKKYGNCEVCGKYVDNVYSCSLLKITPLLREIEDMSLFGHFNCLNSVLKNRIKLIENYKDQMNLK